MEALQSNYVHNTLHIGQMTHGFDQLKYNIEHVFDIGVRS